MHLVEMVGWFALVILVLDPIILFVSRHVIPVCWLPGAQPKEQKPYPPVHDPIVKLHMKEKLKKVRKKDMVSLVLSKA